MNSPRMTTLAAWLLMATGAAQSLATDDPGTKIIDAAGVKGGLVVHVGCGDGTLTAMLRKNDSYLVHGLDVDAEKVKQARAHIRSLSGDCGKVSVDRFDGQNLPYAENLVNLLVAEDLGQLGMEEVMRVLAPGGVAYIMQDDKWQKTVKPRPDEIDEWTHYLHDSNNNAVAADTVVGPPRRYQWLAGPRWARSHDHLATVSALVSATASSGTASSATARIFYIIDEAPTATVAFEPKWSLIARDAFSGVLLWKRPIGPWEGHLRGFRCGPAELARRLVAVGDRVYVTLGYGKPVSALDAATGETLEVYEETKNALEIIHHRDMLFVVVGDRLPDNTGGAAVPVGPKNLWIWWPIYEEKAPRKHIVAIKTATSEVLWNKDDDDTAEVMPTTLAAAGGRVFFQSHRQILALDAVSGKEQWRAERPVNRHRPTWSAPTLVVHGDTVLCGDRAVDAPPPGVTKSEKAGQWVVNAQGGLAPIGQITAFSAADGEKLWDSPCREIYNAPVDVFVADGLVWSGDMVSKKDPGFTIARDVNTGEVKRTRPRDQEFFNIIMSHHRCHRNKATEKYLVLGRDGIELIDLKTGRGTSNAWVRGACQYGVMPCNGLIYAPSHSCACHVESLIGSFNALAPAGEPLEPTADEDRLERGPAYGKTGGGKQTSGGSDDWPTYRHDPSRSGQSSSAVKTKLEPAWETALPGRRLSSPTVADGMAFVASVDNHAVHALDAEDGELLWSYTAGGRVDSPPTFHRGTVIFGSADGWVYCLRAADGRLAWRFQAAPVDRRIVSYGQLESAWPVHGSVLVLDGVVRVVAGRSSYLDGGMVLCRIDATTGKQLSRTPITTAAKPDVLASDGQSVFLRHRCFDTQGVEQPVTVPHLYSPAGFLEGSWWHRTYWQFGKSMGSNWGGWPNTGNRVPAGRLLVKNDSTIFGFGRFNQYHRNGSHVGLGKMRYSLYATKLDAAERKKSAPAARRGTKATTTVKASWERSLPLLTRGMVLSGQTLFVAGPPDVFPCATEDVHPYHVVSAEALREQEAALAGKRGGLLMAVSAGDGRTLSRWELDHPPVFDGMAAAGGRLYLSTTGGRVVCMKEE